MKEPKILFYDIETAPLKAYIWGLGQQVVRHTQLDKNLSKYGIICISYCWNDNKPAKCINWGYKEQDTAKVVREFDKIVKQADHIIGKNNKRFDDKMVNAARLLNGLEGLPDWLKSSDDIEQQMRRYLRLPSYSLEYISSQLGYGGKTKMEFEDWIDIVERTKAGKAKLKKMCGYCNRDVEISRSVWNKLYSHIEPKFNVGAFKHGSWVKACKYCGSENIRENGTFMSGSVRRQKFKCKDCKPGMHYCGSRPADWKKGKLT